MFAAARALLEKEVGGGPYRLIGVGLSDLATTLASGFDLFPDSETRARAGEAAADALNARFGAQSVVSGRLLRQASRRRETK
jgi:DNA polymerase-4